MKNCEKYIDRQNDLKELFSKFKKDINTITDDSVNEVRCLLCKSAYDRVGGDLIAFFRNLIDTHNYNPLYWYALGSVCQLCMQYELAETAYKNALLYDPLNIIYIEKVAKYFVDIGKFNAGQQLFYNAIKLDPAKHNEYMIYLAKEKIRIFDFKAAKYFLNECNNENTGMFWKMLGKCYSEFNDSSKAIQCYKHSLEIENNEKLALELAHIYFNIKNYHEGLLNYQKAIDINKDNLDAYIGIGACYGRMGNYDKALAVFDDVIKNNSTNELAYFNKALIKSIQPNSSRQDIVDLYQKCIKLNSSDVKYYVNLGDVYFNDKDYDSATIIYREGLGVDLTNKYVHTQIGKCFILKSDIKQAVYYLREAIKLGNVTSEDYYLLALAYRKEKLFELSIENYRHTIKLEPYNSRILRSFAEMFVEINDIENACRYFEEAIAVSGNNDVFSDTYGQYLIKIGKFEMATKIYKGVLRYTQDIAFFNNRLGRIFYLINDFVSARECFKNAYEQNIEMVNYKANYILSLLKLKKYDEVLQIPNSTKNELFAFLEWQLSVQLRKHLSQFESAIQSTKNMLNKMDGTILLIAKGMILSQLAELYFRSNKENKNKKVIEILTSIGEPLISIEENCRIMGLAYLEENDLDNALIFLTKACIYNPDNAYNWHHLSILASKKCDDKLFFECLYKISKCKNSYRIPVVKYLFLKIASLDHYKKKIFVRAYFKLVNIAENIKSQLRYKCSHSQSIYHYTKLETLKELLKPDAKLRLYNSGYMNDPLEGKAFYSLFNDKSIESFFEMHNDVNEDRRKDIFHSNTFLASLSINGDSLPMWISYAKDASGCAVALDESFFDNEDASSFETYNNKLKQIGLDADLSGFKYIPELQIAINNSKENLLPSLADENPSKKLQQIVDSISFISNTLFGENNNNISEEEFIMAEFTKTLFQIENSKNTINYKDRYCLYEVCYIDKSGNSVNLPEAMETIKKEFVNINKIISQISDNKDFSDDEMDIVKSLIFECLEQVRYLFKSKDYQSEQEVRLVLPELLTSEKVKETKVKEDQFSRLFIEIEKPLYFKEVVLGAKVDKPHEIVPTLIKSKRVDKITLSNIKYQ